MGAGAKYSSVALVQVIDATLLTRFFCTCTHHWWHTICHYLKFFQKCICIESKKHWNSGCSNNPRLSPWDAKNPKVWSLHSRTIVHLESFRSWLEAWPQQPFSRSSGTTCRSSEQNWLFFAWTYQHSYQKMSQVHITWLVVGPPLWKIWVRQLGWWNSQPNINGKIELMATKPPTSYPIYPCKVYTSGRVGRVH